MVSSIALLSVSLAAAWTDVYLDADQGDNSNAGRSADAALRTPRAARDAARGLLATGAQGVRVVVSGQHALTETLVLGPEDAGMTWRGAAGKMGTPEKPSLLNRAAIHAGVQLPVDAFKPWKGAVLQLDLNSYPLLDLGDLGSGGLGDCANDKAELFLNGRRMTLARYPNVGADGYWQFFSAVNGTADGGLLYGDDAKARVDRWTNEPSLWLHGYWKYDWADNYVRVHGIDTGKQMISVDPATPMVYDQALPKARWYVVNALSELDADGEYYIDRDAKKLFFQPPGGKLDPSDLVVLSNLSSAIELRNTSDVHFENLDVNYAKKINIDLGAPGLEVNDTSVVNCSLGAAGDRAVSVVGWRNRVADNLAVGLGCKGISTSGGDFETLEPALNVVEGNHIESFSMWKRTYQPALGWGGVGSIYRRNTIKDGPHTAAQGGGNDNLFEENIFLNLTYEASDTGTWYSGRSWVKRNNTLRRNVFKGIRNKVPTHLGYPDIQAVYNDDQLSGNTFEDNEFYDCDIGIFIGGGRDHNVQGNKFVHVDTPVHVDARGLTWEPTQCTPPDGQFWQDMDSVNFTQPPYSVKYPALLNIERPCVPVHNFIANNIWCGSSKFKDFSDAQAQEWNVTLRNNTEQPTACHQDERLIVV